MLLKVVASCMILEMIGRRVNFSLYGGKTRGKVADIKGWEQAILGFCACWGGGYLMVVGQLRESEGS
jgi:hypothetical protein